MIKAYIGALVAFLIIDAIWLGFIAKSFYANQLGELMRDNPNMLAAALFYLAYIAGLVYLVISPALGANGGSWRTVALGGAVLGFVAYGTYDMTNYATLKGWPVTVVIVDIVWGTVLTAAAAVSGYLATRIEF